MLHHPAMKAYSLDLREKIVVAVRRGMSKAHAARTFGVGATSVKRYVSLAERGRSLEPGTALGKRSKLGESGMRLLEEDLHERPTVTYENRARLLHRLLGIEVSKATICRAIRRLGYTRKKINGCKRERRVLEGCLASDGGLADRRRAAGIRGRDGLEHFAFSHLYAYSLPKVRGPMDRYLATEDPTRRCYLA